MKRILIDAPMDSEVLSRLLAMPDVRVEVADPISDTRRPLPPELLRSQKVLFCTCPPTNFDDMHSIEWIQLCSAGYEQLLPLDLPQRGVRASNALGVFDVPIAEWCFAMMINLARDLRGMIRNQEYGVWDRSATFQREIRGLTVGFWGYGGLARETARLGKAAGLTVHVLCRNGVGQRENIYRVHGTGDPEGILPDRVFRVEKKEAFLAGLDFLVLAMPLNAATRGAIGETELRMLPRKAALLNPARGPLVDEAALLRALREGWISGAALDTHFAYPMPPEHPLWTMPNVIMTPHISGSALSPNFIPRTSDLFARNLGRYLAGLPLLNELSREQLSEAAA